MKDRDIKPEDDIVLSIVHAPEAMWSWMLRDGVLWTEMSLSIWKCLDRYMSSYLYPVTIANHRAHALAPIYHLTVISDVGFTVVKLKWFLSSTSFHSDSCVFLRCPWLRFWLYIPPFPFSVVVILVSTGLFGCYRKALQSLTFLCFILTHPYYIK